MKLRTKYKFWSDYVSQVGQPTCFYCGKEIRKLTSDKTCLATIDHIVPKGLGGSDEPSNLVWSCYPCNSAKAMDISEVY